MKKKTSFLKSVLFGCLTLSSLLMCACGGDSSMNNDDTSLVVTEIENVTEEVTEDKLYEVRLYSLMPEKGSLMQSFVLRTEHGKLIVIDGGIDGDGFEKKAYMPAALRAIAGVEDAEYVEVEAWFLSHAHKDHFGELLKTLNEYTDDKNFVINNFYFDFPDYTTDEFPADTNDREQLEQLKAALDYYAEARGISVSEGSTYYDDINGAVINQKSIEEGYEMNIDGVRIEFLQTWSKSDGTNVNDSSLVMRMWVEGQSILFLQDTGAGKGNKLLQKYNDNLKSDIVQMAHHGQGGVNKPVYKKIDASVRIWPTPLWVWNNTKMYAIGTTRKWINGGKDFTDASENDIVTCLYDRYPTAREREKVSGWKDVIDGMSIPLPYPAVNETSG